MSGGYDAFKFAVGGTVSPIRRIAAADAARQIGIASFTVWSGVEFEENLRLIGDDLLRRLCEGESFPERPEELRQFANDFPGLADHDALEQMAAVFQRPALETPFRQESSLPDFQTAIEDTFRASNTGIWRTREGETIRRIPSVHHLRDPKVKAKVVFVKARKAWTSGASAGLTDLAITCPSSDPTTPQDSWDFSPLLGREITVQRWNSLPVSVF